MPFDELERLLEQQVETSSEIKTLLDILCRRQDMLREVITAGQREIVHTLEESQQGFEVYKNASHQTLQHVGRTLDDTLQQMARDHDVAQGAIISVLEAIQGELQESVQVQNHLETFLEGFMEYGRNALQELRGMRNDIQSSEGNALSVEATLHSTRSVFLFVGMGALLWTIVGSIPLALLGLAMVAIGAGLAALGCIAIRIGIAALASVSWGGRLVWNMLSSPWNLFSRRIFLVSASDMCLYTGIALALYQLTFWLMYGEWSMMLPEVMQGTLASVTRPGAPLDSLAIWFSSPQSWHGTHRLITGMLGSPLLPLLFIVLGFLIDLIDISTEAMLAIVLRE